MMGDKTPKRPMNSPTNCYSPVTLPESPAAVSPQKNLTGLPRIVRDLAADAYNTIQRWNDVHIKSSSVIKEIASIKAEEPKNFSKDLERRVDELFVLMQSLKHHKDALVAFAKQILASEKLQQSPDPIFVSLSVCSLANLVKEISKAYEDEYNVKEFVLENITYVKCKDDAMFLAALWTYQTKITDTVGLKLEAFLVETGHRRVT